MRIDTQTIRPVATFAAASGAMPEPASGARAMRWVAIAATVVTITAVLLACGLAVVMNLS
jgi:hypothetical protein